MVRPRRDSDEGLLGHDVLVLPLGKREINLYTLRGILKGNVSIAEFLDAL